MRHALRALRTDRGIAILAVAALALGIGANTGIFTITRALIFRMLPVSDPAGLVNVQIANFASWGRIEGDNTFTWPLWQELTNRQDVLTGVFGYAEERFDAVISGETKPVTTALVLGPMFRTLGLDPVAGKPFQDLVPGSQPAEWEVVISHALWNHEFASDPAAIGRPLTIEGKPFRIAGVLPARFLGLTVGRAVDVYMPMAAEPYLRGIDSSFAAPTHYWIEVFARLRPGVTDTQARKRLEALGEVAMRDTLPPDLPERARAPYLKQTFTIVSAAAGISYLRYNLQFPLRVLGAIAGLLLLLTCFTVANLLLARATGRQKDIAVRVALGAGRGRIVRGELFETVLLAVAGTASAMIVARVGAAYLVRAYSNSSDPLILDLTPDWTVFAFAASAGALSAIVCGVTPAVRASRVFPADALKGGRATASASVLRIRRVLLAAQMAVSVVLVAGAVLFGASLRNLLTVDKGFQSDHLLLAELDLRRAHLDGPARKQMYLDLLGKVQRLPLVESAALSYVTPISGSTWQFNVTPEGKAPNSVHTFYHAITPEFLKTYGTSVVAGRDLTPADRAGAAPVAVVNGAFAQAAFGTLDVIGRRISMVDPQPGTIEIVGVVRDAKYRSLRQPVPPTLYTAFAQNAACPTYSSLSIHSRARGAMVLRDLGAMLTREYPVLSYRLTTLETQIGDSIARDRAFALLCGMFAALALVLGAIGTFGVLSYFVAQRTAEIGIRMALGATPSAVRQLIYRQAVYTCGIGLAIGLLIAFWSGTFVSRLVYAIVPGDPRVYFATVAIIALSAAVATAVPAFRASRVNSMHALRAE